MGCVKYYWILFVFVITAWRLEIVPLHRLTHIILIYVKQFANAGVTLERIAPGSRQDPPSLLCPNFRGILRETSLVWHRHTCTRPLGLAPAGATTSCASPWSHRPRASSSSASSSSDSGLLPSETGEVFNLSRCHSMENPLRIPCGSPRS